MRDPDVLNLSSLGRVAVLTFALPILILTFAASAFAQTSASPPAPTSGPTTTQQPSAQDLKDWHARMARIPLPTQGASRHRIPAPNGRKCRARPRRNVPMSRRAGLSPIPWAMATTSQHR